MNGSSIGLNGTSLEDIKELTLNMKVPASFSKKTKTEAEAEATNLSQSQVRQVTVESLAGQGPTIDDDQIDEMIGEEDIESNYITNGSYA